MQAVILCGKKGGNLNKQSQSVPKPLIDINGKPLIWHVMSSLSRYGVNDFILALGFKGDMIRAYFNNYAVNNNDYKLSLSGNRIEFFNEVNIGWNITFADTGADTQTGARLKLVEKHITSNPFLVTYSDSVGDVQIDKLLEHHKKMDRMATATGIDYKSTLGIFTVKSGVATAFREKPVLSLTANAGLFAMNKAVFAFLSEDKRCCIESTLLKKLTAIDELAVYKHDGCFTRVGNSKDFLIARENLLRLYYDESNY